MKILVFAYDLVVSGVTVNAIELAVALRDMHGHEVVLFAAPGPLVKLVEEKGLRYIPAPPAHLHVHPSVCRMRALRDVIRSERPDLVHVWEWVQYVDAFYVEHLLRRVPMVVTNMHMILTRIMPKWLPTTFGTPQVVDEARARGHCPVELLLPAVDIHQNAPNAIDQRSFRERHGVEKGDIAVVTVSRLDGHMKGESLRHSIDAVSTLGRDLPLRLFLVGDGDARADLERLANKANAKLGRPAVVLTGALVDPRPAYAAADIVVGMGGSALRGMAFGKPVVIVGAQGFSAPFTLETAGSFYYQGMYGVGDNSCGNAALVRDLQALAERPAQLPELGEFSRQFVREHFALETVSSRFDGFCQKALSSQPPLHMAALDGLRTAGVWVRERRFVPFK